ncbi:MAG: hypothetical protein KC457_07770 [Myxococcales bacterium]|nr:hypothetical protein [Myxococcales bacterium]
MLYEAELFVSSDALLSLESRDAGALVRLAGFFGFTDRLAEARRSRLAGALERVLAALRSCGIDDAVFASRDGVPCFVDRVELAREREQEGKIAQALAMEILALRQAIQELVDAGDIDAGVLQVVEGWLARRDRAGSIGAWIGAIGFDAGLVNPVGRLLAGWMEKAAANNREARWLEARQALLAAVNRLIERAWDHLAARCRDRGLALLDAATLRTPENEALAQLRALVEVQTSRDGSFERQHAAVHVLARARPLAPAVQRLRVHTDRLAAVRAPLLKNWGSRLWIGVHDDTLSRAQQHFLRLVPGDGVLAFIATTVFAQGKAGLAFTTSSVQWRIGDAPAQRLGYAALRDKPISASSEALFIAGHRIEGLDGDVVPACVEALQACLRLCLVDPGPAVCRCGAPGCWLNFADDRAYCRGCGGHVEYG